MTTKGKKNHFPGLNQETEMVLLIGIEGKNALDILLAVAARHQTGPVDHRTGLENAGTEVLPEKDIVQVIQLPPVQIPLQCHHVHGMENPTVKNARKDRKVGQGLHLVTFQIDGNLPSLKKL